MKQLFRPILLIAAALVPAFAAPPAHVMLVTTIDDFVNMDISGDRIHRIIAMLEKQRQTHPGTPIKATLLFSGQMSATLEETNSKNGLLDALRGAQKAGLLEFGYDGMGEPTYKSHPMVRFSSVRTQEEHWNLRLQSATSILTSARDPKTGDFIDGAGGIRKMQQVFGPATYVRNVFVASPNVNGMVVETGSDSEIVHALERLAPGAVMEGISDVSPAHSGTSNYRGWIKRISTALSPAPDTPPELFWQDGVLRSSENAKMDYALLRASEGLEKLKKVIQGLDRSTVRIMRIEIAWQMNYARPYDPEVRPNVPLRWAYDNPDNPAEPERLRRSPSEVATAFRNEEAVLDFLATEFLPQNSGRFLTPTDLKKITPPGWDFDVNIPKLLPELRSAISQWNNTKLPVPFVRVGDRYLSEAELFAVLALALAERSKTGKLPETVHLGHIYGPVRYSQPTPPARGPVELAAVERFCARIADDLGVTNWTPIPRNAVPSDIGIGGLALSPMQFLHLAIDATLAEPGVKSLEVQPTELFWGPEPVFYRRRPVDEMGVAWTFKPAPVR
jgi:hypothetical protein